MRIGVISDTHGLLRPEAEAALTGCDHILHSGDVGDDAILDTLRNIAPVTAIRGNVDSAGDCAALPLTEAVELAGNLFYLIHRREDLDLNPQAAGLAAVIYGHSHQPEIVWQRDVLFFNPGSAGPKRFRLPVTVGILEWKDGRLVPSIQSLLI